MKRAKRPVVATVLASTMMLGAMLPLTAQARSNDLVGARPGEVAMIGDALFVRPVMTAATLFGTALFTVTLPFTFLGGNTDEAAETLVKVPARTAFVRCLGCTGVQHEQRQMEKRRAERQAD